MLDEGTSGKVKVFALAFFASLLGLTIPFVAYLIGRVVQLKKQNELSANAAKELAHKDMQIGQREQKIHDLFNQISGANQHIQQLQFAIQQLQHQCSQLVAHIQQMEAAGLHNEQEKALLVDQLNQVFANMQLLEQHCIIQNQQVTALLMAQMAQNQPEQCVVDEPPPAAGSVERPLAEEETADGAPGQRPNDPSTAYGAMNHMHR